MVEGKVEKSLRVIRLFPIECNCSICWELTAGGLCLPMYEGEVLPDDYEGEWAGMTVCKKCYAAHRGTG